MSVNEDSIQITRVAESLLASISVIIESVACIELEQDQFTEIGCYIYRVSMFIMELQTTEDAPYNALQILQSLSSSIDKAKDLVNKCQRGNNSNSNYEMKNTLLQLEGLIKKMGEYLRLIPSSTFQNEKYVEVAVQTLADEMQNAQLEVSQTQEVQTQVSEPDMSFSEEELKKVPSHIESNRCSVNVEVSTEDLSELLETTSLSSQSKKKTANRFSSLYSPMFEYLEPTYETFFCPLTKQIMDDPVTVESGVTYERKAITKWFEEFDNSQDISCPITGQKLLSRVFRNNIALKTTIDEWKERNEEARIKVSRAALSLASSASMVLEAISDLRVICKGKQHNKILVRSAGILPLIVKFLQHRDRNVRCAALEFLQELAEDDEDGKELIAKVVDISAIIKMLSSGHQPIRNAALLLLLELSNSQLLCEKIGSVPGGILMLIRTKYNQSMDSFASKVADQTLRNLERSVENIKHMAENGLLEPLLNHLTEGSEEIQMEMASYLGEIVLGQDSKTYVAERASPALIKMVHTGNTLTRSAAFKALAEISSYHPNGKILTKLGTVEIMLEEIFARRIYEEPMNSTSEAAAILANIFEAGIELENLLANTHGHKFSLEYVVYNIISMLRNTTPDELTISFIRILLCLTKSSKSIGSIVSLVKKPEASYTLTELINSHHEQVAVSAIKLLITLSPHMGHTLVERLCNTRDQPENLIQGCTETTRITEKQAVSAKLLAELPHQNITLNLALLSKSTVPRILQIVDEIRRTGTRTSRYASPYLEGLVGILVRFTTTLYEPQILLLARYHNFTLVFTELLMEKSSDEVQKLSAIALENLSSESINLSKSPAIKKTKFLGLFCLSVDSSRKQKIPLCPIHKGACSSQNTFCLVDAKAVGRLLVCLEHENVEIIEAALSAICTLLDDNVDVERSVSMLSEMNAIQNVLNVVKEHSREGLQQKSLWVIERLLIKGGDKSVSDISQDRLFLASLVGTFHHGDDNARQRAEKILRYLNKMPNFPTYNHTL